MDVLDYWGPTIDWTRFDQGDVSDQMWTAFRQLVQPCHCVEHWRESHRALSLTRPPSPLYTPESRHYRKKRLDEWKRPIQGAENHMHAPLTLRTTKWPKCHGSSALMIRVSRIGSFILRPPYQ